MDIPKSTCPLSEYKIFRTPWVLFPSYKKKRKLSSRLNFNFPNAYLFHKRVIKLPTWYGEDRKEYVYYYVSALRNAVNKFKK
ncbi:MAG TPA: hypothetical protein ENI51_05030 [Candidatus Atribacteria bacterium]|nr:hypothetical protein [Candidatus Atribacteria bacterium]